MNKKTLDVRETIHYQNFYMLGGVNRPVQAGHVSKIRRSILKMGCTRPIVIAELNFIDGVKRKYVIDGQHLLTALMSLDLPVPYKSIEVENKKDLVEKIALLNASSKSWSMIDYVRAWGAIEKDYTEIMKIYLQYNLSIVAIVMIAMNRAIRSSIANIIKGGRARIVNQRFNEIVKYASDIVDALEAKPSGPAKERIVEAFLRYVNNQKQYNHQKTLKRVKENREKILSVMGEEDLLFEVLSEFVFI